MAGVHLGCIHESDEERLNVLAWFVRDGLRVGDRIVCLLDARTASAVADRLRHDGQDPAPLLAGGQLELSVIDRAHLPAIPDLDPDRQDRSLVAGLRSALAAGYAGLRVAWQVSGQPGDPACAERTVRRERLLNGLGAQGRFTALCLYDRRLFDPGLLLDVLRAHPSVMVGSAPFLNPHFVPPVAPDGADREAALLTAWLTGLAERKAAEDALREARLRLERTIEGTGAGTWETNLQTGTGVVSERWAGILGYTLEDLEPAGAEAFRSLVHPDDLVRADDLQARHLAGELPDYRCELRMRHRDGHWVWIESRGRLLLRTDDGRPLLMFGIHLDISERQRAEEGLRAANLRTQRFIDSNLIGIVVAGPDGEIIQANDYYLDTLGFTREDLERGEVNWRAVTPPEWLAADEAALRQIEARGMSEVFEKEYLHRDGRRVPVLLAGATLPGEGRELATFVLDISARKQAERAVRHSEERYRQLFDSASDAVFVIDRETLRIVDANLMATSLYGWSHAEMLEHVSPDLSAEPDVTTQFIRQVQAGPEDDPVVEQRLHRRKDGSVFPAEVSVRTVTRDGTPLLLVAVRDITERRAAEEAIRQMAVVLDAAPNAITVYDLEGRCLYANPKALELHGYGREEFLALDLARLTAPGGIDLVAAEVRAMRDGGEAAFEVEHVHRDGGIIPLAVTARYTTWSGRQAILAIYTDISELREAQERADLAQRAEMVGRLAGGVAHDFNNLLTAIGGYAELLAMSVEPGDPRRRDVDAIREATARAAELTRQLLAFGRRETLRPTVLRLADVVAGLMPMLRSLVPEGIELVVRHDPDAGTVRVDRDHLERAVANLVLNANDAMSGGGTLTIETAAASIPPGDARLRGAAMPGDYVRITVADTGTGIPAELVPHLFEPFFTTKRFGEGAGLGLSSVDGFVAQSKGFLAVETALGRGSAFSIFLARNPEEPGPASGPASRA